MLNKPPSPRRATLAAERPMRIGRPTHAGDTSAWWEEACSRMAAAQAPKSLVGELAAAQNTLAMGVQIEEMEVRRHR